MDLGAWAEGMGKGAEAMAWIIVVVGMFSAWFVWIIAFFNTQAPVFAKKHTAGFVSLLLTCGVHVAWWVSGLWPLLANPFIKESLPLFRCVAVLHWAATLSLLWYSVRAITSRGCRLTRRST